MSSEMSRPATTNWQRFAAGAVRVFHTYANWLVSITWKRFFVLSLLLIIAAAILENLPPFRWSVTDVFENDSPRVAMPAPPRPPRPPAAPDPADLPNSSGITIEAPRKGEAVSISIDKNGVRIVPRSRLAAAAASAASAAEQAASSPDLPEDKSIRIDLPPGATTEAVKEAIEEARDAVVAAMEDARQAREDAAEAARDAADAVQDERAPRSSSRRVRVVHSGDFLTDLALVFIAASAILKAVYKGRIQAEVKAAAATETAESEQLKRQVVEARMAAMQAQVEPHFLFNTLASIDHLIETDPPRASQMQKNLIALLRASMPTMRESHPTAHNLGREMAVIKPYLAILKVRMEDRLQTDIQVPDGLLSAEFPSMMIQSLVENAIKHGLEPKAEGGRLTVKAEIVHGKLAVTVADTGLGFGKAATAGTGTGLANIRERLQLLHGNRASVTVAENAPSGTLVTLTVPYLSQARDQEAA